MRANPPPRRQECVRRFEALHAECAALGAGEAELGMVAANIKFARQAPAAQARCKTAVVRHSVPGSVGWSPIRVPKSCPTSAHRCPTAAGVSRSPY